MPHGLRAASPCHSSPLPYHFFDFLFPFLPSPASVSCSFPSARSIASSFPPPFFSISRSPSFVCLSLFSASINVFTRSAGPGVQKRANGRADRNRTLAEDRGIGKQRGLCAALMRLRRLLSLPIAILFFSVGYNEAHGEGGEETRGEHQIGNWYVDCVRAAPVEKKR